MQSDPAEAAGEVAIALRQSSPTGSTHRLAGAVLEIRGPLDVTLSPADSDDVANTSLPVGDYQLTLLPGYRLEREVGGQWQAVTATLISPNPLAFTIVTSQVTRVSLRFAVDDQGPVTLQTGTLEVALSVESAMDAGACAAQLVINEIDYDQVGSDSAELVEIYNASACDLPTAGLTLALVNGGVTPPAAYAQVPLDGVAPVIPGDGYLVVGAASVIASLPPGVLAVDLGTTIQNGSPDGARLELGGTTLDSLSYGGALAGATEGVAAPSDPGAGSIGRCPDGRDSDDNAADFVVSATPTPGAPNACGP
jgi:hypothetical protein